ncbi:MAG TPA: PGPGW domain-containing protein [Candidatus Paceibacterota bacterium]|nr:PGPGW domain-containing protein [Candidatus Paceibacterota bacterium]
MKSASVKGVTAKLQHFLRLDELSPCVRKVVVGITGGLVLLAGIAMIALPGPAFIAIPLGLAILAIEFGWARHSLQKAQDWFTRKRTGKARQPDR